jgi:FeS assembly protein IscX
MRWTDIHQIAIALEEAHPHVDNVNLRFTDLRDWVLAIPGFTGDANGCNEKILEAIQMAWIDERD